MSKPQRVQPPEKVYLTDEAVLVRLRMIEALSKEIRSGLNLNRKTCRECGHHQHANWDHAKMRESLTAMESRCIRWIDELERKASASYTAPGDNPQDGGQDNDP